MSLSVWLPSSEVSSSDVSEVCGSVSLCDSSHCVKKKIYIVSITKHHTTVQL